MCVPTRLTLSAALFLFTAATSFAEALEWIEVSDDGSSFVKAESGGRFAPWGFNYDHDRGGQLLEDYWRDKWSEIEQDFKEMRDLGANVVRVHLQLGKFMEGRDQPNERSLEQLERLLRLAQETGLYLDITGLGCYHKQDVPAWYDKLEEQDRWQVQARFWEAVATRCKHSSAVFCYDLMNEPVAYNGKRRDDWLGPGFAGKHFVQFISLEGRGREKTEIARQWIDTLVAAIRKHDKRHLITVGLVPWSLEKPGLQSGFVPGKATGKLDFIAVHLYPEKDRAEEALETLKAFDVGKPLVIEETFPLKCGVDQLAEFIDESQEHADGWITFYWGTTREEYREKETIGAAITAKWLEVFEEKAGEIKDR